MAKKRKKESKFKKKTDFSRYEKKDKKLKHLDHHSRTHLTFSQRAADVVTKFCGSWTFIIFFCVLMAIWMIINVYMVVYRWDPYPFILLNFVLSTVAALQAPIILMSQNREADRDRIKAERDFLINRKAEKEIKQIQTDLKKLLRKR